MSISNVVTNPSQDGPKLSFNTGAVTNGVAVTYQALPDTTGNPSAWQVTEWSKGSYLNPSVMTTNSANFADSLYGNPLYSWQAPDQLTSLNVYKSSGGGYVYGLDQAGTNADPGGTDLFLSTSVNSATPVTFNHPINFSMNARLAEAQISYTNANAKQTGAVLSQLLAGFTVCFNVPGTTNYDPTEPTYSAFMQIEFGSSRQTGPNELLQTYLKVNDTSSGALLTYSARFPQDPYLPFVSSTGQPQLLDYNLNQYLEDMISRAGLPAVADDLSRWLLLGMYVGIESNSGVSSNPNQGSVITNLQLSNISVTTDTAMSVQFTDPNAHQVSVVAPTMPQISYTDTSTGTSGVASEEAYQGGYAPLKYQYVANSDDNMAFASVGNGLFLVTGKGNDAILVSAGDNVIDAGAGSNFIKSGSGNDIIFENLGSSSVWDTIINFHPGDAVGIWGFVPASSTMTWAPTVLGTSGYEGLTLLITNKGIHDELTFTGASAADIRSLAITTGVSSGQSYLEIRHL